MRDPVGPLARRLHLLLVGAVALFGVGILVLLLGARLLSADSYSGDMAVLAMAFTAPFWLVGLIAATDMFSVLRGRPVKVARAASWALLMVIAGFLLGHLTGLWYLRVAPTDAGFWMPLIALALGLGSLGALLRERRNGRSSPTHVPPPFDSSAGLAAETDAELARPEVVS
jgi:hypothetical protein